jgi:hypothetical protein
LLSLSSHPSILNITIVIITSRKYLIAHSTGTITIPRAMKGRQKKQKSVSPQKKLVQEKEEMKKTDTQIQTPTKRR